MAYVWYTVGFDSGQFFKFSKTQRIRAAAPAPRGGIAKIQHSAPTYLWSYLGDCQNSAFVPDWYSSRIRSHTHRIRAVIRAAAPARAGGLQNSSTNRMRVAPLYAIVCDRIRIVCGWHTMGLDSCQNRMRVVYVRIRFVYDWYTVGFDSLKNRTRVVYNRIRAVSDWYTAGFDSFQNRIRVVYEW